MAQGGGALRTVRIQWVACLILVVLAGCSAKREPDSIELTDEVRAKCLQVLREAVRAEGEDNFWPSMHAAEALTLAGEGAEVRELLGPKLGTEKDDQKRCGLARELVRAGDREKAQVMLDILAGEDDYGHVHAAESLYKVNEIGDGVAMRAAMGRGGNPKLMLMAAAALARVERDAEAYVLLRRELGNEDPEIAQIAAWILARIGDESDIPALRVRLNIVEPLPHAYIEHALATLGDAEGLAALEKNLSDEDAAIRTYAATFAGDARATGVKDRLVALLDDGNIDVRVRAAQSLLVLSQPVP